MTLQRSVPDCVLGRLPNYLRALDRLDDLSTLQAVTSRDIANASGQTAALVRRDLRSLGHFGKRGTGYPPERLRAVIGRQLGLERSWRIAVVGTAFLSTSELDLIASSENFLVSWTVDDLSGLESMLNAESAASSIEIAVIAMPERYAQAAADLLCEQGVRLLLNCTPAELSLPPGVRCVTVNPLGALRSLAYQASSSARDADSEAPTASLALASAITSQATFDRQSAGFSAQLRA